MTKRLHTSRRAVTLVEVLVTVAVTVLLTLLIIVGMRSLRGQTLAMKDLQNLRLSAQDMITWSTDNDEKFLNLGTEYPGLWVQVLGPQFPPLSNRGLVSLYWGQQTSWNSALWRLRGEAHQTWQSAYGPRSIPTLQSGPTIIEGPSTPEAGTLPYAIAPSRFLYSPTFLTSPAVWSGDLAFPRLRDLSPFFALVRLSQVVNPSGKGLLLNNAIPHDVTTAHAVFVDGSAERRSLHEFLPAAAPPTAIDPNMPGTPVLHTLHGYEGRDR